MRHVLIILALVVGHTTGAFHHCKPGGKGGDAELNALKNRDRPPAASALVDMTVSDVIADKPAALTEDGERDRTVWDTERLREVQRTERVPIRVIGYIAGREKQAKEKCNCDSKTDVDYHVWLVEKPKQTYSKAMVVELSPRLRDKQANWPELLQRAHKEGWHVRVSGWRTWDQEHLEQLHPAKNRPHARRATMWEIHPVHRIEVEVKKNKWVELERAADQMR